MARLRVNGQKLREIITEAGFNPDSDTALEAFGRTANNVSVTSLKRWLANGGIHQDMLTNLAEALGASWDELRLKEEVFPLTEEQREEAPFEITFHVYDENSSYKQVIDALRKLLLAVGINVVIHVTKVRHGSLIITFHVNDEWLAVILSHFSEGRLRRLSVRQVDLPYSSVRAFIHWTTSDVPHRGLTGIMFVRGDAFNHLPPLRQLQIVLPSIRWRQLTNDTVGGRLKRQQKPATNVLHV